MDEAESNTPGFFTRLRQRLSRRAAMEQPEDFEREIQHIIVEGEERGLITRQEGELIESIFEFKDTLVREIMVPRLEMVGVERQTPLNQIISLLLDSGHSRLPVFDGDIDHIKGILLAKDAADPILRGGNRIEDGLQRVDGGGNLVRVAPLQGG